MYVQKKSKIIKENAIPNDPRNEKEIKERSKGKDNREYGKKNQRENKHSQEKVLKELTR